MRALRNIPVLVGIARDMAEICPDAWMLNITNPMTTLCRAVTRETDVKTVGLCHEIVGHAVHALAAARRDFLRLRLRGRRRQPPPDHHAAAHRRVTTGSTAARAARRSAAARRTRCTLPAGARRERSRVRGRVHRSAIVLEAQSGEVRAVRAVRRAARRRATATSSSSSRDSSPRSPSGASAGASSSRRSRIAKRDAGELQGRVREAARRDPRFPTMPSGEMVAPMIDSFLRDKPRAFPLNLPNVGQAPDLPPDVVVEAMCIADGSGLRGRDEPRLPAVARRMAAADRVGAGGDGRGRAHREPRQGGRGDAARPARGPHRLRPPRADDRRDARGDEAVAAAVRVKFDELTVEVFEALPALARAAALDAARCDQSARSTARGEANVMLATGNSQLAFLAELVQDSRHRVGSSARVPHGRIRRPRADASRELPALHARTRRVAASAEGVPLPDRRHRRRRRPRRSATPALLRAHPLDLCCCGIGENGHLAFNDPPVADFDDPRRREDRGARAGVAAPAGRRRTLRDDRRRADARHHRDDSRAPARRERLLAIVPEARKAAAVERRAARPDLHRVSRVDAPPPAPRHALPRRRVAALVAPIE